MTLHRFNREKEFFEQKLNIHRDFYNIRKVDNLLDHASAANVNLFLTFVKEKFLVSLSREYNFHFLIQISRARKIQKLLLINKPKNL